MNDKKLKDVQEFFKMVDKYNEERKASHIKTLRDTGELIAQHTDKNNHTRALILAAQLLTQTYTKPLIEDLMEIEKIHNDCGALPNIIFRARHRISEQVHELGRAQYGEHDWNKYIYSNT